MSQQNMTPKTGSEHNSLAAANATRKRYVAPQLEIYGSVPELTQSTYGFYNISDFTTYYTSNTPS